MSRHDRISLAWWAEINSILTDAGYAEALWGDVKPLVGWSAQGAADYIMDLRDDDRLVTSHYAPVARGAALTVGG